MQTERVHSADTSTPPAATPGEHPEKGVLGNRIGLKRGTLTRGTVSSWTAPVFAVRAALFLAPLVAVAGAALWAMDYRDSVRRAELAQRVEAVGSTLAGFAERIEDEGSLSTFRVLLADAARAHHLSGATLELPDGRIIADADPSAISQALLPEDWPKSGTRRYANQTENNAGRVIEQRYEVNIPGRGPAVLTARADANGSGLPSTTTSRSYIMLAALAGAVLLALMFSQGIVQKLLMPLLAIRSGGRSLHNGETDDVAASLSPRLGADAECWNTLAQELIDLRRGTSSASGASASTSGNGEDAGPLTEAFNALSIGAMILDASGTIRFANGAASILMRARRNEDGLVGSPFELLSVPPEVVHAVLATADPANRKRRTVEAKGLGSDGRTVVRFSAARLDGLGEPAVLVTLEDVTQQRIADQAREAFVAQATHELRTPLTNIRLYVDTLMEGDDSDPKLRGQCINVINQETARLDRMVSDMLNVAEIEAGTISLDQGEIRTDQLLTDVERDFQAQAKAKNITLSFDLPPKLPVLRGDRGKVQMTLYNLIGNALKYTPSGGEVTINAQVEGGMLEIEVTDTGFGISGEETEKVFEKFYRSKDERVGKVEGTGLGLALSREIARLHGGDITLRSELNKGSTFTLLLPAPTDSASASSTAARAA